MSRQLLAIGLVVVLIASILVGLGTAVPGPAPAAGASLAVAASPAGTIAPAATAVEIEPFNGHGTPTTLFCTGSCATFLGGADPLSATILFSVRDTAGDRSVNVTINDQNATRDGLTNPVYSAELGINSTTDENLTQTDNFLSYTFPGSLAIGGTWNITVSAPLGGFTATNLTVETYSLALESSPDSGSVTVPGETVTVSWIATASGNESVYNRLTTLTATGTYVNQSGDTLNLFSPGLLVLPVTGAGSFSFVVPAGASTDGVIDLTVWAVVNSSGQIAGNETGVLQYYTGVPEILRATLTTTPGCVYGAGSDDTFASGSPVFVCVWVEAVQGGRATEEVPGLALGVSFWDGVANATPGGNPPTTLTSVANAPLAFSFLPTAPPFSSYYAYPYGNYLNLTLSDPAANYTAYPTYFENHSFQVIPSAASGLVSVTLNAANYLEGQTVFVNWTLTSTNASVVGKLSASQWVLVTGGSFVATGPITSHASSGMTEVPLPATYTGMFTVVIIATNASGAVAGAAAAYAIAPSLAVGVSNAWYTPGQGLSLPVAVLPSPLADTTVYYNITGIWVSSLLGVELTSAVVAVGTVPTNGAVSYSVPSTSPATYYEVSVWAQSPTVGVYAYNTTTLYLETGFAVEVGISTPSSYSDGSYQPGQTIQVTWSLAAYSGASLPTSFSLYLEVLYTPIYVSWSSTSSSGTVPITIPSGIPTGSLLVELYVYAHGVYGPNCATGNYCFGLSGLTVNAHPSVLNYELGAGSGVTVGWLILLILILVVALVLVLLIRRGRRASPAPAMRYTPPNDTISPPAPAPSGPPATEWRENSSPPAESPPATAENPPPLPTPPAEAPSQ